ncbi:glycosyltransferase [Paracoccus sp. (in: a-proteobacteria)]|uniref:glycosyltransferase n=1 Tax=Paracoccus sp. TaxID=267 RepID=UPI0035B32923
MSHVLILMATHNGEAFLGEQLDSIAAQDHRNWSLAVSDDASADRTRSILDDFRRSRPAGQVMLLDGPGQGGATGNFRSLLRRVAAKDSHLAFCDQDDVWDADHLSRGIDALSRLSNPLGVYGCRMRICDAELRLVGLSPRPRRPLGFRNALVQNVLSGNTMILTPQAADLLARAEPEAGPVPVHDWWAYQLVTGAGGAAVWDAVPGISYRQHGANVIGANRGLRTLPARLRRHLQGNHRQWALQNAAALRASAHRLVPENRQRLEAFAQALSAPMAGKLRALRRSGAYHQGALANAAFLAAVLLGRF